MFNTDTKLDVKIAKIMFYNYSLCTMHHSMLSS